MIWWYRCYRPGEAVNRVGGVNGILLLSTAAFGIAGVVLSLTEVICNLNAAGGLTDRDFTILVEKCGI